MIQTGFYFTLLPFSSLAYSFDVGDEVIIDNQASGRFRASIVGVSPLGTYTVIVLSPAEQEDKVDLPYGRFRILPRKYKRLFNEEGTV